MAALNRPVTANYQVHETVQVDTQDNEDHTFCGIMFPIKAKAVLPVDKLVLRSVSVRGQLGHLTVWISNDTLTPRDDNGNYQVRFRQRHWTRIYSRFHTPSQRHYVTLDLTKPIVDTTVDTTTACSSSSSGQQQQGQQQQQAPPPVILRPGQVRVLYIHSTLEGDEAIVYDNSTLNLNHHQNGLVLTGDAVRYQDSCLAVYTGKAHLSTTPFGPRPIWGWGNAWRDRREFVGQLHYGTVYQLWNPERHALFGRKFDKTVIQMKLLQRLEESSLSAMPDECIYYILNMCRWDWFQDNVAEMERRYRVRKQQRRRLQQQQEQAAEAAPAADNANAAARMQVDNDDDNSHDHNDEDDEDTSDEDFIGENDDDDDESMEDASQDGDEQPQNWAIQLVQQQLEAQNDDSDNDDDDDDDSSDESEWERTNGYRADRAVFAFRDVSSDDDDDESSDSDGSVERLQRQGFFRRNVARIQVLQALAGGGRAARRRRRLRNNNHRDNMDDDSDES